MRSFILLSDEFDPSDFPEHTRQIDLLSKWHMLYPWVARQFRHSETDRLALISD